jgi:hypothetical protein
MLLRPEPLGLPVVKTSLTSRPAPLARVAVALPVIVPVVRPQWPREELRSMSPMLEPWRHGQNSRVIPGQVWVRRLRSPPRQPSISIAFDTSALSGCW